MKIRVLGCSGAIAAGYKTTAFLLDDDVLIDAGTGVGDLALDELARIDHVFVTGGLSVAQHGVCADRYDEGFPSDHLPVLAEFE